MFENFFKMTLRDIELALLEQRGDSFDLVELLKRSDFDSILQAHPSVSDLVGNPSLSASSDEEALIAGVVALQTFMQLNWTGPSTINVPESLKRHSALDLNPIEGEIFSKCRQPHLLHAARRLFRESKSLQSWTIWLGRADFALQRVLSDADDKGEGHVLSLLQSSIGSVASLLGAWGIVSKDLSEKIKFDVSYVPKFGGESELVTDRADTEVDYWGVKESATGSVSSLSSETQTLLITELASRLCYLNKLNSVRDLISRASEISSFGFRVTGKDGIKRKYQTEAFAQMTCEVKMIGKPVASVSDLVQAPELLPKLVTLQEIEPETDILEQTVYSNHSDSQTLTAAQQSILLTEASRVFYSSHAKDELMLETVNALVTRALQKDATASSADWLVFSFGLYLKCKAEFVRNQTKGRSCFQLEVLVNQFEDKLPIDRCRFVYSVAYPSVWEIHRELGIRMMSVGMLLTAYEMFSGLEMWQNAVDCLAVAGRKSQAVELLEKFKTAGTISPGLLCSLGDLTKDSSCYQAAWELSGQTCARAQRAIGRFLMKAGDWLAAASAFELALKLAPLHADIWFSLGAIYMRLDGEAYSSRAANAFVRSLGISDEDPQTWGNLCACYSRNEALTERAKVAAYEAVKRGQTNWKLWENYLMMCARCKDTQGLIQAERALSLNLNREDHPNIRVIKRIAVDAVSKRAKEPFLFSRAVGLLEDLAAGNKGGWCVLSIYANLRDAAGEEVAALELQIRCLRTLVGNLEASDAIEGLNDCLTALVDLLAVAEPSSVPGLIMTLKSIPKRLTILGKTDESVAALCDQLKMQAERDAVINE